MHPRQYYYGSMIAKCPCCLLYFSSLIKYQFQGILALVSSKACNEKQQALINVCSTKGAWHKYVRRYSHNNVQKSGVYAPSAAVKRSTAVDICPNSAGRSSKLGGACNHRTLLQILGTVFYALVVFLVS